MKEIKLDKEFRKLLPNLTSEEYKKLEKSIIKNDCRDPLVLWNGILIDGNNRHKICTEHNKHFSTVNMEFDSREEVELWIIKTQLGRRNLTDIDKLKIAGKLKALFSEIAKKNQGKRTDISSILTKSIDARKEAANIAGVSTGNLTKFEFIEENASNDIKEKVMNSEISIDKGYRETKKANRPAPKSAPPLPDDEYEVIYADPPWQYEFSKDDADKIENHYPTMPLEEIKDMDILSVAADNSVLYLWATMPKLKEALEVIEAWGFNYLSGMCWDKEWIGTGYWWRGQHELLLVATKGDFSPPLPKDRVSSVLREKRTGHSVKPMIIYEWLNKWFPNKKKLELFARKEREGFTSWGNEI